ncbi:hypothetical protein CL656_03045 [bacterium]|nr:hypothetical protein [bacterium]|tara:strand:+ start:2740 stop:3354 length:615 start_codon:yes stop_codon:yes gene_type:complete
MNLWSQNLPEEFQNKEFKINENLISLDASDQKSQEILRSIAEKIVSSISIKVYKKIANTFEYVYGANFLSYVCLEVLTNDILLRSLPVMLNTNNFVDSLQLLTDAIQNQGFSEDLTSLISQRYNYYISIDPAITVDFIHPIQINKCNLSQINAYTLNIPFALKQAYISQYIEVFTKIFYALLSHSSKSDFNQFIEITKESSAIK